MFETLDSWIGVEEPKKPKYVVLRTGLSYNQALEYLLANLKTHPNEKTFLYLPPNGDGGYIVYNEVLE